MKPTEELALQFETQRKLIQENAALQARVDELKDEVIDKKSTYHSTLKLINDTTAENKELIKRVDALKKANTNLREKHEGSHTFIQVVVERNNSLEKSLAEAEGDLAELQERVDELERYYALYQRGVNFNKARNIISGD